jgi:hypothetical protein
MEIFVYSHKIPIPITTRRKLIERQIIIQDSLVRKNEKKI